MTLWFVLNADTNLCNACMFTGASLKPEILRQILEAFYR